MYRYSIQLQFYVPGFFDGLDYLPHFSEETYSILMVVGFFKLSDYALTLGKLLFKTLFCHLWPLCVLWFPVAHTLFDCWN
jgi:hypothetical protein